MAAFTMNSVTSLGPWLVADGQSTDVSASTVFIADATGANHLVKSIQWDYVKGTDDRWVKVLDGTDLQIGPAKPKVNYHKIDLGDGLLFEDGVYFQTESDAQFHVTVIYKIIATP